jgi:hypothetical protein
MKAKSEFGTELTFRISTAALAPLRHRALLTTKSGTVAGAPQVAARTIETSRLPVFLLSRSLDVARDREELLRGGLRLGSPKAAQVAHSERHNLGGLPLARVLPREDA